MVSPGSPSSASNNRSGQAPTTGTPKTSSATEKGQIASKRVNAPDDSIAQLPETQLTAPAANTGPNEVPVAGAPPGCTMRPRKPPPPAAPKRVRGPPRPRAPPPPPIPQPAMIRNTIIGGRMVNPRHRDSVVSTHRRHPQMAKPWNDLANEVKRQDEGLFEGEEYEGEEVEETEDEEENNGDELGEGKEDEGEAVHGEVGQGDIDVNVNDAREQGEQSTDSPARKKHANVFESDESQSSDTPTQPTQDRKAWLRIQQEKWDNE